MEPSRLLSLQQEASRLMDKKRDMSDLEAIYRLSDLVDKLLCVHEDRLAEELALIENEAKEIEVRTNVDGVCVLRVKALSVVTAINGKRSDQPAPWWRSLVDPDIVFITGGAACVALAILLTGIYHIAKIVFPV